MNQSATNKNLKRVRLLMAMVVALMSTCATAWSQGKQSTVPELRVQGAVVATGSNREARLILTPVGRWIPAQGYRVYRQVGSGPAVKIWPSGNSYNYRIPVTAQFGPREDYRSIIKRLNDAAQQPTLVADYAFALKRGTPSGDAFNAFKTTINANKKRAEYVKGDLRAFASNPNIGSRINKLRGAAKPDARFGKTSPAEDILDARRDIMSAVLVDPAFGRAMGLRVNDPNLPASGSVTYRIHRVEDGTESAALATLTLNPAKPNPAPSISGIEGVQISSGRVGIRWNRPSPAEEAAQGNLISYRVLKNGQPLSKRPVIIADIEAPGDELLEPLFFYIDEDASLNPKQERYQIIPINAFGQEGSAASLNVDVDDLRIPEPPANLKASPINRAYHWNASAKPEAKVSLVFALNVDNINSIAGWEIQRQEVTGSPNAPWVNVPLQQGEGLFGALAPFIDLTTTERTRAYLGYLLGPEPARLMTDAELNRAADGLFKRGGVLAVHDATAVPDKTYRYRVATKTRAGLQGEYAVSNDLTVPNLTPPVTPTLSEATFSVPPKTRPLQGQVFRKETMGTLTANVSQFNQLLVESNLTPREIGGVVKLKWTRDTSQPQVSYAIYRRSSFGERGWTLLTTLIDKDSFEDKVPPTVKGVYVYRIEATNRWGISTKGGQKFLLVPACGKPTQPSDFAVRSNDNGSITVETSRPAVLEEVVRIKIYRKSTPIFDLHGTVKPFAGIMRMQNLGSQNGTNLQGLTLSGNGTNLGAVSGVGQQLNPYADQGYELIGEITGDALKTLKPTFVDQQPPVNRYCWYRAVAVNVSDLESVPTTPLSATAVIVSATPVAGLTATSTSQGVELKWNALAGGSGGLLIERAPVGSEDWVEIASGVNGTSYVDRTVRARRSYTYRVFVLDTAGNRSAPTLTSLGGTD
jgi:hypothetical protein